MVRVVTMAKHSIKSLQKDFKEKPAKSKKTEPHGEGKIYVKLDLDGRVEVATSGDRSEVYGMMLALVHSVASNEGTTAQQVISTLLMNTTEIDIYKQKKGKDHE